MKQAILSELNDIIVTIAGLEENKMKIEEKNFMTGRLVTFCNILELYLTKLEKSEINNKKKEEIK